MKSDARLNETIKIDLHNSLISIKLIQYFSYIRHQNTYQMRE